jgi:hypothetical protein
MTNFIFLSKGGEDEYVNMFARSVGVPVTNTDDFDYSANTNPIVLRGILKHKIMKQCWQDSREFYYIDSGYFGNQPNPQNPNGWKLWHRIVKNDLQHGNIVPRPSDRWDKLNVTLHPRRYGNRIIVAAPDEKPCKFYGVNYDTWVDETVAKIKQYTDRPVVVRQRAPKRIDRTHSDPLAKVLADDVHALVTFNSAAAVESVVHGVPAFTLAPTNAASPVASQDLSQIDSPYWADQDKIHAWACHLAYGQFHVNELKDGTTYRILNAN